MSAGVKRKILVVDDYDVMRTCCVELLAAAGYDADAAINGMEALERLRGSVYDLVISDVSMPVLDGIGLYAAVEKEYPYLAGRFVFFSGDIPQDEASRAVFARASNMVLKKPFKPAEFWTQVGLLTAVPVADHLNAEGINRRREQRHAWIADCSLRKAGDAPGIFAGKTQDISESGMRIKFAGTGLLNAGDEIFVRIGRSAVDLNGQVAWAKAFPDGGCQAGLKLNEQLPVARLLSGGV